MIISVCNDLNDKVITIDTDKVKPPFNLEYSADFDFLINSLLSEQLTKAFGLDKKPNSPYYYMVFNTLEDFKEEYPSILPEELTCDITLSIGK